MFRTLVLAALSICLLWAQTAHAGAIHQPASASTNMGSFGTFEPVYAHDQSGLTASYTSGVTDFDTFTASTATVGGGASFNTWFSSTSTTGNFDFDLGGTFTIESFVIWADPQGIGQGVNSFNLVADDDPSFSSPTLLGTFAAADGPGNSNQATNFGQVFTFPPTSAAYVRMEILSNHGSTLTTGMVEAAFELGTPAPVPTMSGWMQVAFGALLGLGGFAALTRRARPVR